MNRVEASLLAARGKAWLQRWLRRHLWKPELQQALLPAVGTTVGGYQLEARRGAGGFGTVYRARRGGRLYALKFIYLPRTGAWGWRELEVLLRLRRVGALPLEGHGHWPDKKPLFLFLAMEYVDGRPLYAWAQEHRPTARQVARLVGALAQQLVAVHSQGVVHRDVKGDNVLVRSADGVPVLVDFGVGTYPGAPRITGATLPGTAYYRGPEALRFRRQRVQGEHYEASGRDDLWALGVVLYRLLTGRYPFDGDEAALEDGILFQEPASPRALNPRVPQALSELCLRLLAKAPEARCPDAQAVCAALEAVLKEAGEDVEWDAPLSPSWHPAPAPARSETTPAPTRAMPPTSGEVETEEVPTWEERVAPRTAWGWGGAVLVLGLVALLAAQAPRLPWERGATPVRGGSLKPFGQEVAPGEWRPEGDRGAAPPWAATPAPVARATPPEDMRVKTHPTASTPQEKKPQKKKVRGATARSVTAVACTALAGCASPQAVRPVPPEDCPPEAVEAMRQLDMTGWGNHAVATFFFKPEFPQVITVSPGQGGVRTLGEVGKLPGGSRLSGRFFVGEGRLHGRFTEARTPYDNKVYPVCMELTGEDRKSPRGVELKPDSTPEAPRVFSTQGVRAVERFE
jgi:serine/threonine-protein kinase